MAAGLNAHSTVLFIAYKWVYIKVDLILSDLI